MVFFGWRFSSKCRDDENFLNQQVPHGGKIEKYKIARSKWEDHSDYEKVIEKLYSIDKKYFWRRVHEISSPILRPNIKTKLITSSNVPYGFMAICWEVLLIVNFLASCNKMKRLSNTKSFFLTFTIILNLLGTSLKNYSRQISVSHITR